MPLPPNPWLYGKTGVNLGHLFRSVVNLSALWEPHTCLTLVTALDSATGLCLQRLAFVNTRRTHRREAVMGGVA